MYSTEVFMGDTNLSGSQSTSHDTYLETIGVVCLHCPHHLVRILETQGLSVGHNAKHTTLE